MTISRLFSLALDSPESPLYTQDRDDFTVARNSIRAFLEDAGKDPDTVPLLEIITPGWTGKYLDFLLAKYKSNKPRDAKERTPEQKQKWAFRYLKCLRKVVNTSIRQGLLPNVDCFAEIPEFARRQGVEEPDSAADVIQRLASRGVKIVKGRHAFNLSDLYLLALYCGGIEIEDLIALPKGNPGQTVDVPLPENIRAALAEFLRSSEAEKAVPAHVAWFMETERLRLYRAGSVFVDWLRYAAERHLDDLTVRRLAEAHIAGVKELPDDLADARRRVAAGLAAACNRYRKLWYCLISSRKTAAERFEEIAALSSPDEGDHPLLPFFAERRKDFYFLPQQKRTKKDKGANRASSVLKRYLFLSLYPHETDALADRLENVRFLRAGKGSRTLAVIPPAELYKLQLMLQSIDGTGATLSLEDDDVRAAIDTTPLALREKVRIAKPGYESYEAEIIKVGPADRYSVRFPHLNLSFILTDIPRALITKL